MGDKLVIRKDDPVMLKTVVRNQYPDPVAQGLFAQVASFQTKLGQDRSLSAKEIFDQTVRFQKRWERAYREGRSGSDWLDVGSDLLNAAGALSSFKGASAAGAIRDVGKSVLDLSFVQDEAATSREIYARQSQAKLARLSQNFDVVVEDWAARCLENPACAEAAAFTFPAIAVESTKLPIRPAEVVSQHGDMFSATITEGVQPDGSITLDGDKLRSELKEEFARLTTTVRAETKPILEELTAIRQGQETVLTWIRTERASQDQRRKAEELAQKRTELIRAAEPVLREAHATLGVVTSLMGLVDPRLASDVARVGGAAIQVARASVELVQVASNVVGKGLAALVGAGAMAATGNFIGAAVALISSFLGGPSTEEQILEEIRRLREDMRRLHQDMSNRFDRIDQALDKIYTDVMTQLDKIDIEVGRLNDKADRMLAVMAKQSDALNRVERNLSDYFQAAGRAELQQVMDEALFRGQRSNDPQMAVSDYQRFEAAFYTWAARRSRDAIESSVENRPVDDVGLPGQLSGRGLQAADELAYVAEIAHVRGWVDLPTVTGGESIPNPDTWSLAADAYSQLEGEWPLLAASINSADPDGRRDDVRDPGRTLLDVLHAFVDQVDDLGRNSLMRACVNVGEAAERFGEALELEARKWEAEQERQRNAAGIAYVPAWWPREPPPDWTYAPPIRVEDRGMMLPDEVTRRLPIPIRAAVALSLLEMPITARAVGQVMEDAEWNRRFPAPARWIRAHLTLTLLYRGDTVARYKLVSPFPEVMSNRDIVWEDDRWNRQWKPALISAQPDFINVALADSLRPQVRAWQEGRCRDALFPSLQERSEAQGSALSTAGHAYVGARLLLDVLTTLAIPTERQFNDVLRAALDGRPITDDGIAVPDLPTIVGSIRAGEAWSPKPPEDGGRPLAELVSYLTGEPLQLLNEYFGAHRNEIAAGRSKHQQPVIENALKRLNLARVVVDSAISASKPVTHGPTQRNPQPTNSARYTVKVGDTLAKVARTLQVAGGWQALYAANRSAIGPDPNNLRVGLELVIPPTANEHSGSSPPGTR